ncbi:alpha/beta hydrolase [Thermosyntropha sp.]|uniref:alpha/beta fold hydrolase n=1 Tax=Thermosyntropha sp. TaxID=2740820 RepID=UPI0025E6910A|nr:alpha/beta hydrolase [Thermosyntropha sp.]MBO8158159.1 alpha/beta hydrolase [Thermosyntropha sp.]
MADNYHGTFIRGEGGSDIYLHCWDKVDEARGVVQIFHGMAEHGARYYPLVEYFNRKGFVVYADDHRGHGRTAKRLEDIGYIGEDGFNKIVKDEYIISNFLGEKYKGLPLIIIAHSFGSFIAQEYMIRYGNKIDGAVLCGSAAMNTIKAKAGYILASLERAVRGEKHRSRFLDFMSFGSFNRGIKDNKSRFSWLSTDKEEVRKYEEDPYCGEVFTTGFFYYLAKAFLNLYKPERLSLIPKDLPVFIIAGDRDPVGEYGRLVKRLYNIYLDAGCRKVSMKLYSGKRHELFNEVNRKEVFDDIWEWMQKEILG